MPNQKNFSRSTKFDESYGKDSLYQTNEKSLDEGYQMVTEDQLKRTEEEMDE